MLPAPAPAPRTTTTDNNARATPLAAAPAASSSSSSTPSSSSAPATPDFCTAPSSLRASSKSQSTAGSGGGGSARAVVAAGWAQPATASSAAAATGTKLAAAAADDGGSGGAEDGATGGGRGGGARPAARRTVALVLACAVGVVALAVSGAVVAAALSSSHRAFSSSSSSSSTSPSAAAAAVGPAAAVERSGRTVETAAIGAYELAGGGGSGVAAIHAAVVPETAEGRAAAAAPAKVVFMERWDIHGTDAQLPDGSTAWSVEYDTATDTYRSLRLQTNLFCAGGALLADGRVASLGGAGNMSDARVGTLGDGQRSVRTFGSWPGADWVEAVAGLATGRWYPSAANLPDGRVLVVGGSSTGVEFNGGETNVASFEVLGGGGGTQQQPTPLQFLWDALPANLYPVTAVLPSGRVFVFAGYKAIALEPSGGGGGGGGGESAVAYREVPIRQVVVGTAATAGGGVAAFGSVEEAAAWTCVAESSAETVAGATATTLTVRPCEFLDPAEANLTALAVSADSFVVWRVGAGGGGDGALVFGRRSGLCWELGEAPRIGDPLLLANCDPDSNGQLFNVTASTIIVHVGSNLCVSASDNSSLIATDCSAASPSKLLAVLDSKRYFEYSRLPGGPFRSYPWTGSGALLPLDPADNYTARVLICGGSMLDCGWGCVTKDCHDNCQSPAATALQTCGLLAPDAPWSSPSTGGGGSGPQAWDMSDTMPAGRVLADLVHLPDGTLLLINGAHAGMAGTNLGRNASLEAWQYAPLAAPGARWRRLNATTVPRVYHSTAVLLPDARVLVAGSAPNDPGSWGDPTAAPNAYATERRVEYYYPPYLTGGGRRPAVAAVSAMDGLGYGSAVQVLVGSVDPSVVVAGGVDFALVQSGFRTHSTGHAQRMVWLAKTALEVSSAEGGQALYEVVTPPTPEVAPPGWYMLFAVAAGVPSVAAWVQIGGNPSPLQL